MNVRCMIGLGWVVLLAASVCPAANHPPITNVTGVVRLKGDPPRTAYITPRFGAGLCGIEPRAMQVLDLGPGQTIKNAIVYIVPDTLPDGPVPAAAAAVLDQRHCEFTPRIQIASANAPLVIKNSDPWLYVVRIESLSGTGAPVVMLTEATPYAGYEKQFQFAGFQHPTLLRVVNLNGHDWMIAYLAIMPHSWAALTDESGRFALRQVSGGRHTLHVWHEVLGTQSRIITVTSGEAMVIEFEYQTPSPVRR